MLVFAKLPWNKERKQLHAVDIAFRIEAPYSGCTDGKLVYSYFL